jgi:AcrR family transcriptional regulator
MLQEVGAEKLTMRKVAAASGVSPTTLYNRFGTKDSLISVALVEHFDSRIASHFEQRQYRSAAPLKQLQAMLTLMAENTIEHPSFTETLTSLHYKSDNESTMTHALFSRISQELQIIVEQLQEDGELVSWASPQLIATELADKLFSVHAKYSQGQFSDELLIEHSCFSCFLVIRGVAVESLHKKVDPMLKKSSRKILSFDSA